MMREFAQVTAVVGRREALRCVGIGLVAAAGSALLAACGGSKGDGPGSSVKGQALAAFAVGAWDVTFPLDDERHAFKLTVDKSAWRIDYKKQADASTSGAWKVVAGSVQVKDWQWKDSVGTATGAPSSIGGESTSHSLPWVYQPNPDSMADDPMNVGFEWHSGAKTMTIRGVDANGEPLVIKAKRA